MSKDKSVSMPIFLSIIVQGMINCAIKVQVLMHQILNCLHPELPKMLVFKYKSCRSDSDNKKANLKSLGETNAKMSVQTKYLLNTDQLQIPK